jgi:hypothetical protein
MTASDTSPRKGHEFDGASDHEQRVLRELIEANTQMVADQLRESRRADLLVQLEEVRRAQAELSIIETLLREYVEVPQDIEDDE